MKPHSDSDDRESRAQLHADADELWGRTQSMGWEATADQSAWIATTNTWALPHFAEQAAWLRRRRTEVPRCGRRRW